jgi:hypothetical protein
MIFGSFDDFDRPIKFYYLLKKFQNQRTCQIFSMECKSNDETNESKGWRKVETQNFK